jgi:uncharacterized membrane protein
MSTTLNKRIVSIDVLRGIVMVLMALDHTRDYFTNFKFSPTDLEHASTAMFLTRWITHFCAPVFIFLSGSSALLSLQKGKSKNEAALFLLKRGLWLILLEVTVVRFGWLFNLDYNFVFVQVIWAIGWSMVCLSALIYLPLRWLTALSLLVICSHNLLDGIHSEQFGANAIWWDLLHEQNGVKIGGSTFFVAYPVIPWIAVMSLGYCFGKILLFEERKRNKLLYQIGLGAIALFIALRFLDIYGDPLHWQVQDTWEKSVLSFINCEKYPPSLLYLLMTLGPAVTLLPLLEKARGAIGKFFMVYGKVPMFYYILHLYLIHGMALAVGLLNGIPASNFTSGFNNPAEDWGYGLPGVYLAWCIAILILYFPCRWFVKVKERRKDWWLGYL